MALDILTICYLFASITFIVGLKMLSTPATAKRGNRIAALGMLIAIAATIFLYKNEEGSHLHNLALIAAALAIGTFIGFVVARKVKMTAMPEMVSLFNGMGGACAALISIVEFNHISSNPLTIPKIQDISIGDLNTGLLSQYMAGPGKLLIILLGLIIGSISFAGSVIAWGKLNGRIKDYAFKGQHIFNLVVFGVIILLSVYMILNFDGHINIIFFQSFPGANS